MVTNGEASTTRLTNINKEPPNTPHTALIKLLTAATLPLDLVAVDDIQIGQVQKLVQTHLPQINDVRIVEFKSDKKGICKNRWRQQ